MEEDVIDPGPWGFGEDWCEIIFRRGPPGDGRLRIGLGLARLVVAVVDMMLFGTADCGGGGDVKNRLRTGDGCDSPATVGD